MFTRFSFLFLCAVCLLGQTPPKTKIKPYNVVKDSAGMQKLRGACGEQGYCIAVPLSAPGNITAVSYTCEGKACALVHPCPDGGKCGTDRPYDFDPDTKPPIWYAWTNSGEAAVFKFKITYEDKVAGDQKAK